MSLRIASNLTLPPEACTQTFAILAKRGAGKTYTAAVMAAASAAEAQEEFWRSRAAEKGVRIANLRSARAAGWR